MTETTTPVTMANGPDELKALVGHDLGHSEWIEITQERVDTFADATGDHQWIHVDPERAADGPFGAPIAHGYLTLSLTPFFLPQILQVEGFALGINYGCEKVRFPSPVVVGSRLRCGAEMDEVTDVSGGVQCVMTLTFEVEGSPKPACVATIVVRRYV